MRRFTGKALSLILCLTIILSGFSVFAESSTIEGGFSYSEIGVGACSITGYTGTSTALVMPSKLGGLSVVAIADGAFKSNTNLVSVAIPNYVKVIGSNAFAGCTSLVSVMLTEGVQAINASAFSGCTSLMSITIPSSTKSVGAQAFADCTLLSTVNILSADTAIDVSAFQNTPYGTANAPAVPPAAEIVIVEPEYTPIDEIFNDLTIGRSSIYYSNKYDVSEGCAVDGKLNTAWNANQNAVGEWLSFTAPKGEITTLAGIRIINGYIKNNDVFKNNSRVRSFDLYVDGVFVETLEIADSKYIQTVWLSEPVSGNSFRFEVASAYYGNKHNDLCITEIELLGVNNEDFHTGDFAHWGRAVKRLVSKTKDGSSYRKGDNGYAVLGLQILLKRGFGLLDAEPDGDFGDATRMAVLELQDMMRSCEKASEMEAMSDAVVDGAFMRNLRIYIKTMN